jgi:uncharacterized membrane protein YeaQ/YmgE (transglycosylase-associated protein family)
MHALLSELLHLILRILHHILQPMIKWSVLGMIGGFVGGKIMRSRGWGSIVDIIVGAVGAYVGRRIGTHLGFYSDGTNGYILGVALSSGALLALMMRLAIGGRKKTP